MISSINEPRFSAVHVPLIEPVFALPGMDTPMGLVDFASVLTALRFRLGDVTPGLGFLGGEGWGLCSRRE